MLFCEIKVVLGQLWYRWMKYSRKFSQITVLLFLTVSQQLHFNANFE